MVYEIGSVKDNPLQVRDVMASLLRAIH
jgi:hypothetical protein